MVPLSASPEPQEPPIGVHQRCSINQSSTHAAHTAAITANVTARASTNKRAPDVGRRTTAASGQSATTPAKSRSGSGKNQLISVRYQTSQSPAGVYYEGRGLRPRPSTSRPV
jgi:hypothetical protein